LDTEVTSMFIRSSMLVVVRSCGASDPDVEAPLGEHQQATGLSAVASDIARRIRAIELLRRRQR
jgi:hypothetical protein